MLFKLYVPSSLSLSPEVLSKCVDAISRSPAGGCTTYMANGAYADISGEVHHECTDVIEVFVSGPCKRTWQVVRACARMVLEQLEQKTVLATVDSEPVFFKKGE